jgi:Ca-activated chloride channel family protein
LFGLALTAPGIASAIGILVPTDPSLGPMAVQSHRVDVEITDRAAVTKVDQVFRNQTDRVLEATYIFPLPAGSSVSEFALWINGQRTEGEVLEREAAARIYQDIVARLRDPGLIEYMGSNLFKARVFPIAARDDQRVEIQFTSTLTFDGGIMRYVYPMKTSGEAARTLRDFTLTARIDSAIPIQSIYSPTHEIDVNRRDDHHATAGFEREHADLGKDFQLYYTVSAEDVGLSLITYRDGHEDGFFMMMVTPRNDLEEEEVMGKHITFVIDTSGSMSGDKIEKAKEALTFCLDHLRSDDLFNVIRFSSDVDLLSEGPLAASSSNLERAREFVGRMRALGGTAISDALDRALEQPVEEGVPHMIVFLTDGMPTVGETDPGRIVDDVEEDNDRRARIFVFGLGEDVNANFLDLISQENRGASEYARGGEELEQKLSNFYAKIAFPVMADLVVKIDGDAEMYDVFPREMPDLFHGSQLLLLGRYRGDGDATITLGGRVGDQTKAYDYEVNFPEDDDEHDFLPHMWATRKVGYLLDNIRLHGENRELKEEVVALGRRYGIVTPYTSFLVTEDQPAAQAWRGDDVDRFEEGEEWGVRGGAADESRGGWGPRPTTTAMPAPPASAPAEVQAEYMGYQDLAALPAAAGRTSSEATAGESGRRMSERLRDMREANREQSSVVTRYVSGRLFLNRGGAWIEDGAESAGETLEIRYLSQAYFDLLARRPDLREVLSMGENVTLKIDDDKTIVIRSSSGRETISSGDLTEFLED